MICNNCGSNLNSNDTFCPICGARIVKDPNMSANNMLQGNQAQMSTNINQNIESIQSTNQSNFSNNNFQPSYMNSTESFSQNINTEQQNNMNQDLYQPQQSLKPKNKNNKVLLIILIILGSLFFVFFGVGALVAISTNNIQNTISKSRTQSYYTNVLSLKKELSLSCDESDDLEEFLEDYIDNNSMDLDVEVFGDEIIVTAKENGKFSNNLDVRELKNQRSSQGVDISMASKENNYKIIIENPCNNE